MYLVDASCSKCNIDLKAIEYSVAVRMNGKAYFVGGANIDSFGDAHEPMVVAKWYGKQSAGRGSCWKV